MLDITCVCPRSVLGVASAYTKTDHTGARSHQTQDDDRRDHGGAEGFPSRCRATEGRASQARRGSARLATHRHRSQGREAARWRNETIRDRKEAGNEHRGDLPAPSAIKESVDISSKGVIKGSSGGIIIENMSMNSNLTNDDIVVVNDSRVGEYLVLGRLQEISENPAATSRSGYVEPIIDYEKLITVFVRVDF